MEGASDNTTPAAPSKPSTSAHAVALVTQKLGVDVRLLDNIDGSNYFKLRDLSTALGFEVDHDNATPTMIVKSR